jgi:hypothetical protein
LRTGNKRSPLLEGVFVVERNFSWKGFL